MENSLCYLLSVKAETITVQVQFRVKHTYSSSQLHTTLLNQSLGLRARHQCFLKLSGGSKAKTHWEIQTLQGQQLIHTSVV